MLYSFLTVRMVTPATKAYLQFSIRNVGVCKVSSQLQVDAFSKSCSCHANIALLVMLYRMLYILYVLHVSF